MKNQRLGSRLLAAVLASSLLVTVSVTSAQAASATEPDVVDWSTLSESSSDLSTAEFVSEVILADTDTLAIEPGAESEAGVIVPQSLDEPITIGDLSFDVPSSPGADVTITETGDVIVPSVNEGADLLIQELDTSSLSFEAAATRTLITIDSQDVDPLFEFSVDVPEGGTLDIDSETGSVVAYDSYGNVSSVLAPPWAYDAEGTEVPTWFEIEDGHVYQYVDHLSRQFAYPIVADPVWFVPVLLFAGRLIIKEVVSATLATATAAAIKNVGTAAKHRSWTDGNKRHNLIIWTKRDPGNRCDAHHTLPQKFATYFAGRGFTGDDSIHHPKYLVWWESSDHRSKASAVNSSWQTWINNNPKASKTSVLNKRTAVLKQYPPRC